MWKSKLDGLHFAKWNLFHSFLAGCGGTLFDNSGLLTSPGYPNNYPNNTHCEWTITAPSGRPLSVSFSVFSINPPGDCAHNYLILYNGPDASSPPFGTYCGTVSKTNVIRFSHVIFKHWQSQYRLRQKPKLQVSGFYFGSMSAIWWQKCYITLTTETYRIILCF